MARRKSSSPRRPAPQSRSAAGKTRSAARKKRAATARPGRAAKKTASARARTRGPAARTRKAAVTKKAVVKRKVARRAAPKIAAKAVKRTPTRVTPAKRVAPKASAAAKPRAKVAPVAKVTKVARATKPAAKVAEARKPARKSPAVERERRSWDDSVVPGPPSSLDFDRSASAARSGRRELLERHENHTETSPALTGGDVDADWESAYSVGDEAPGGDNPTPDQGLVDDIGLAVGVAYDDDEELKGEEKVSGRDRHRWELDPGSSDDFDDR